MSKFCIFATGFVGSADVTQDQLVNSKPIQATAGSQVEVSSSSLHPVNRRIVENYITLIRDPGVAQTFNFRAKAIKDIKEAFGMPFLDPWFGACFVGGYMDVIRQRFLDETVNYICGKGRGMPLNIYMSGIGIALEKQKTPRLSEGVASFLGTTNSVGATQQNTIRTTEFLQAWISQPGGFSDMVGSAMIFWGDHSIR